MTEYTWRMIKFVNDNCTVFHRDNNNCYDLQICSNFITSDHLLYVHHVTVTSHQIFLYKSDLEQYTPTVTERRWHLKPMYKEWRYINVTSTYRVQYFI